MLFKKKKLYVIKYTMLLSYNMMIPAKDEVDAFRKFNRRMCAAVPYRIDSIEEYKINK